MSLYAVLLNLLLILNPSLADANSSIRAAEFEPSIDDLLEVVPRESDSKVGTWESSIRFAYTGERVGKNEALASLAPAWALNWSDRIQLRGELPLYFAKDDPSGVGLGVNLGIRAIATEYHGVSLFGEFHGGVLYTSERFPDEGTIFNFLYYGGVGTSFPISDTVSLEAGWRFQHLSNFFIEGRARNPASNMLGGFLGLTIPF